jgi:hypothetical protein
MAGKFVDLKEAAKMLGVTPEELVEMRSRGDIFGYRDGASWKFKIEEVERVMAERKSASSSSLGSSVLDSDEDFEKIITSGLSSKTGLSSKITDAPKASDSVLITEQELGHSAEGTSSTIIGKEDKAAAESDLRLADAASGGSDKLLEAPGSRLKAPDKADVLGGDLKISSGSGTGDMPIKPGSGTGDMPVVKPGSGTGDMPAVKPGSGLELSDDLDLQSSEELDLGEDLKLAESTMKKKKGSGSDVTLGAGDSGINLKPSDSGLNLEEEALDLGGSAVESLELPEDEEVISLEEEAGPEEATQLKADDQFMLSPSDALQEDESDSGSQVIALEDSAAFDENAATLLKQEQPAVLGEETFAAAVAMPADQLAATVTPTFGAAPVYVPPVEAPYSISNVLALGLTVGVLALCGMLMVDIMLNMWSWTGSDAPVSTGIMEAMLGLFGLG